MAKRVDRLSWNLVCRYPYKKAKLCLWCATMLFSTSISRRWLQLFTVFNCTWAKQIFLSKCQVFSREKIRIAKLQFEINFIVSATVIYEIGRQKVIHPMRSDKLYVLKIIYKWDECTFIELGLLVRARFRPGPCIKSAGSV